MKLNAKQRQYLKGLAHSLEPVVRVGKAGASEAVVGKTRESLKAHELIKVRIDADNPERGAMAEQLSLEAAKPFVKDAVRADADGSGSLSTKEWADACTSGLIMSAPGVSPEPIPTPETPPG